MAMNTVYILLRPEGLFLENNFMNMLTKKILYISLTICFLLFSSCLALPFIPGYINENGNITAPYSKEIVIEAVSGELTIIPAETSKGRQNINPSKSDSLRTQTKDAIYLQETKSYTYYLEGNNSLTLAFRTISDEAVFKITYRNKTTEYIIHKTDLCDKFVYIENY